MHKVRIRLQYFLSLEGETCKTILNMTLLDFRTNYENEYIFQLIDKYANCVFVIQDNDTPFRCARCDFKHLTSTLRLHIAVQRRFNVPKNNYKK